MSEQAEKRYKRWPSGVEYDPRPTRITINVTGLAYDLDEARELHRDLGEAIAEAERAEGSEGCISATGLKSHQPITGADGQVSCYRCGERLEGCEGP